VAATYARIVATLYDAFVYHLTASPRLLLPRVARGIYRRLPERCDAACLVPSRRRLVPHTARRTHIQLLPAR